MPIDLNSDVGESFGQYGLGDDARLMPHITSANIACGLHAGDPLVMRRTVALALDNQVSMGAHPGYPDLQGFGRRAMHLSPDEVEGVVLYQLGALNAFVTAAGGRLSHLKPHGALYHHAATDPNVAEAIAKAVASYNDRLIVVGPAHSEIDRAASQAGLKVAREAFVDRAYEADGRLLSRRSRGAVIKDPIRVVERAVRLASNQSIRAHSGESILIPAHTLCLHGDTPDAIQLAQAIRRALTDSHIDVRPLTEVVSSGKNP